MKSGLELELLSQIRLLNLPEPEREYRFHPVRRWRFDLAYPEKKIAFEIEGGTWTGGRHVRPDGFEKDCEKYNEATRLGWKVYRFTSGMIQSGEALKMIEQEVRNWEKWKMEEK